MQPVLKKTMGNYDTHRWGLYGCKGGTLKGDQSHAPILLSLPPLPNHRRQISIRYGLVHVNFAIDLVTTQANIIMQLKGN